MADNERVAAPRARAKSNSVAVDDKEVGKKTATPSTSRSPEPVVPTGQANQEMPAGDEAGRATGKEKKQRLPSTEAGDLPETVRKRYYADKAKWSGDPAYFTSAETKDPAFRDQGRRLVTATESQEVVKDLVAIAQHRGWEKIHVTGSEAFRRSVWLEAGQKGLEVRGYKPNDRDWQELDRLRGEKANNTIAPMTARDAAPGRSPGARSADAPAPDAHARARSEGQSLPNERAVDSQLRVIEAVIRRSLFENPEAVTRVMTVARAQLDAHVAAGRTIQPAVVRDTGASAQRTPERSVTPGRTPPVRQGRDHKPQERSRSR